MSRTTRLPPHAGITSLEVLCATVLAALLMTAVLGVTSGFAQHARTLAERDPTPRWVRQVQLLVERDYLAATSITWANNGWTFSGPLGRDANTGVANWLQATVDYRLIDSDDRDLGDRDSGGKELGWLLVRSEREQLTGGPPRRTEIVCGQLTRLAIQATPEPTPSIDSLSQTSDDARPLTSDLDRANELPRTFWITLQYGATPKPKTYTFKLTR